MKSGQHLSYSTIAKTQTVCPSMEVLMKRKALIALTVFSILAGSVFFVVFLIDFYPLLDFFLHFALPPPFSPARLRFLSMVVKATITLLLCLLAIAGNYYTLIVTRGFTLWTELPRRVKVIAVASWIVCGGIAAYLSLELYILIEYYWNYYR